MPPVLVCFLINDHRIFAKSLQVAGMSENKSHAIQQPKLSINLFGWEVSGKRKYKYAENFHLYYPQNEMRISFPIPEFKKIIIRIYY